MKKIYKYAMIVLSAMTLASCSDFLDQAPLDSYTDDAVWSDLSLAELYLNSQYANIKSQGQLGTRDDHYINTVYQKHLYGSENITQSLVSPDYVYRNWDGYGFWSDLYKSIYGVNLFLDHIDDVPGDTDTRDRLKGEGLFIRAYFYHKLYSLYGRVVIMDHVPSLDDEFNQTRADMDDVADFIEKDLNEAIRLLPVENDLGRATRGAAMALKSRLLLWKASPLFGTPSQAKWQAASDAAKALIDAGYYSLPAVSSWQEYAELSYSVSDESIFVKLYDKDWNISNWGLHMYQSPCGSGNGFEGWGNFNPTQNLVDDFQMADGTAPEVKEVGDSWDEYPWGGREMRFYAAFLLDGDEWGYGSDRREVEVFISNTDGVAQGKDSSRGDGWWNATETGYSMRKFMNPDYDSYGDFQDQSPWNMIRYPEVILNYAECQINLGNNAEALKYINMIRTRVGLPEATGADIWAEYEYEREMELLFEGYRWYDLRRWMRMEEEYSKPVTGIEVEKFADGSKKYTVIPVSTRRWGGDKYYWQPISRSELNKCPNLDSAPY